MQRVQVGTLRNPAGTLKTGATGMAVRRHEITASQCTWAGLLPLAHGSLMSLFSVSRHLRTSFGIERPRSSATPGAA